jgi:hypothetical protein
LKKFGNRKKFPKTGEKALCSNYQRMEMFLTVQIEEELHFFQRSVKHFLESYVKE